MPVESLWSCLRRRELGSRNLVPFRAERFNVKIYFSLFLFASAVWGQPGNFKKQNYFLEEGYISRDRYCHFDDRGSKDECQNEVYELAYKIANANFYQSIGDIGCGSGFKLIKYFSDFATIGFEIEPTLAFLKEKYPNRRWMHGNFFMFFDQTFDLLICADGYRAFRKS